MNGFRWSNTVAASIVLGVAGAAWAQPTMQLGGAIFDFRNDDPDFTNPDNTTSAGAVSFRIGRDGYPVFKGAARNVDAAALDSSGDNIAAHMVDRFGPLDLPADEPVFLKGADNDFACSISLVGVVYNVDDTSTWTYHVEEIGAHNLSQWSLALNPMHVPQPGTTAGFSLDHRGKAGAFAITWDLSDTFTQGDFDIVLDGWFDADLSRAGVLADGANDDIGETILAPASYEVPTGVAAACVVPSDKGALLNGKTDCGIVSMSSFARWFTFLPGVNLPGSTSILLTETDPGVFTFETSDFRPIDWELYGNDETGANRDFTMHIQATFDVDAAEFNQFIRYTGSGDCWVFIDGMLMLELVGANPSASQTADIDRLCLEPGTHTINLFYAQRGDSGNLKLSTNLKMTAVNPPTSITLNN
jgi:fibro-slime domain-containing protein